MSLIAAEVAAGECPQDEKSAPCASGLATLPVPTASVTPIDLAIETCRKAHARAGALSEWGTAAAPTLAACLEVLAALNGNPEAEARLYEVVTALEMIGKAPVRSKTALLAVLLCRQPQTPRSARNVVVLRAL